MHSLRRTRASLLYVSDTHLSYGVAFYCFLSVTIPVTRQTTSRYSIRQSLRVYNNNNNNDDTRGSPFFGCLYRRAGALLRIFVTGDVTPELSNVPLGNPTVPSRKLSAIDRQRFRSDRFGTVVGYGRYDSAACNGGGVVRVLFLPSGPTTARNR